MTLDKLVNETSESVDNVAEPIIKVVFIHLLPLNCKTWPFDKLFNEISESPDNVDVKFKVVFVHFPFEKIGWDKCKTEYITEFDISILDLVISGF